MHLMLITVTIRKAVKTFWGRNEGTFGIESQDMKRYLDKSVVIRGHEINLTPIRKRRQQDQQKRPFFDPDGVKVKIYDAFSLNCRSIKNKTFDDFFTNMGVDIIKQTQPERCKERRDTYNTNRFLVVKNVDENGKKIDLGERISVSGTQGGDYHYGGVTYAGDGGQTQTQTGTKESIDFIPQSGT